MTAQATTHDERIAQATETTKTEATKAQICFGALMATATIAGIWGAVSLMISYFTG